MTVKYYAILTNQGAARLANATMLGSKLNLTQMAVGDANGVLPTPDPAQTKLINQKRIAPLNLLSVDPNNQSQIIAEQIIPENEGGFWIREIGLYDDEGVLIAVANCPETYKPQLQEGSGRTQTIRMILVVTNTEAITLKIDPSVVLATRKYVDDKISEHEQSRRHPDASLTVKGFTQLSSAINSESETLAATPKAVKAAYDLANGKYTAQNATTTQKGIVQLSSATNSTSETLAATPKAVKVVMDETNKKAPLNSPALTGTPTTPTAPQGTNSTQIASTAFVMAAIAALVDSSPDALNTLNELAAALGNDPNFATTMTNALAGKQPKDATLTALAELATSADKLPYFTGADRAALTALTSVGRAILGKTSTQGVLDYLGLQTIKPDPVSTKIFSPDLKKFLLVSNTSWGMWNNDTGAAIALPVTQGGTGQTTVDGVKAAFGIDKLQPKGNYVITDATMKQSLSDALSCKYGVEVADSNNIARVGMYFSNNQAILSGVNGKSIIIPDKAGTMALAGESVSALRLSAPREVTVTTADAWMNFTTSEMVVG
ncbi:phage tail protein, partial [Escherichia coli]|uniref:phage tail protein n=2 Tax=Enterobacteriaceae TaxID=543 RepID=UPI00201F079B